ncbi:CDP-glycerol glycerophosphotransferase family protein [[Enterobacter] lignolyticus]|uniref:Glycosyltransferase 2-like domain-containing protein n=1 Tax=[Enterobacter] lignolyticus TaxID=1334193 RepID=A0A806X2K0_9ENTR|nr:CDP-glycerol glycerophosphotransferase family protein [[Enterobacter] lignolyticus]ALR75348.1 hypothetical protein AO703_03220 [[Enterobacter] lignolyticus]
MLNAKIRKLIRDPNLFFSDMVKNKKRKISNVYQVKEEGHYSYTIVSAVYNVGKYLDDFFKSIVNQKLDFKKHIHLIMVDDGSLDDSASIIQKWQKKFPNNISYIWKENGGQSSARNLGLEHVKTEWVTFVDPDDFLDAGYFYNVDLFLNKNNNKKIYMIGCNVVFFMEKTGIYKETHPLNYKFSKGDSLYHIDDFGKNIQLSASTAIFRLDHIKNTEVIFDINVKPNFEDGKFIADYLIDIHDGHVAFMKNAKYYYRKREDGTSTLDTAWEKRERFTTVPKLGYLSILNKYYEQYGAVPVFIQRTIIYEIVWNLKWLVNHAEKVHFLSSEERECYINNIVSALSFIDKKTIIDFELAGCWFYYKVGILSCFKRMEPDSQIVYIERYDSRKELVQLRYFTRNVDLERITINNVDEIPAYAKTIRHDFLGTNFVLERRLWVKIEKDKKLNVFISNIPTKISLNGKQSGTGILVNDIINYYVSLVPEYKKTAKYLNSWILMDRDTQADDNAEHLYKYIRDNHQEQKIFFVLRKESHDWSRLQDDGFNLISFGSHEHENALRSCSKVISSHADKYVTNFLGPRMLTGRHFVFLQHGVTKDDISGWLNRKEDINCFITASPYEYQSISEDYSRYYYTEKEVVLTGFPRHDALVSSSDISERLIIIMPTWRQNIVGATVSDGNIRELNPLFMETDYAKHWKSVLHASELRNIADKYGYKIAFFPHANIQPYLISFDTPDYIEIITHKHGSIQQLFNRAAMMITDYSSVAFEMAVQNKPTLYYQFDADECFSGGHIYSKGYFDYYTHGFGPVVTKEDDLFYHLNEMLKCDAIPSDSILNRMMTTFPFRDGRNCERTYNAIKSLDYALDEQFDNKRLIESFANYASINKKWALSEYRWSGYITKYGTENQYAVLNLVESLVEQGKIDKALGVIKETQTSTSAVESKELIEARALLYMAKHEWEKAIGCWKSIGLADHSNLRYCACLAFTKQIEVLEKLCDEESANTVFIKGLYFFASEQWDELLHLFQAEEEKDAYIIDKYAKYLLLMAHAYKEVGATELAHSCLVKYESKASNDPQCRYEIARLAFATKNWGKVIKQLSILSQEVTALPQEFIRYYLISLSEQGKSSHVDNILMQLVEGYQDYAFAIAMSKEVALHSFIIEKWGLAENRWRNIITLTSSCDGEDYAYLIEAIFKQRKVKEAKSLLLDVMQIPELEKMEYLYVVQAKIFMYQLNWESAAISWELSGFDHSANISYLTSLAFSKNIDKLSLLNMESEEGLILVSLYQLIAEENWEEAFERLSFLDAEQSEFFDSYPKLILLMAYVCREFSDYSRAHQYLVRYEKIVSHDPQCHYEIARLAFINGNWNKFLQQIDSACREFSLLNIEFQYKYINVLDSQNKHEKVDEIIDDIMIENPRLGMGLLEYAGNNAFIQKNWSVSEERWNKLLGCNPTDTDVCYAMLIESLCKQGKLLEARKVIQPLSSKYVDDLPDWLIRCRARFNMANHNWCAALDDWILIEENSYDNNEFLYCVSHTNHIELLDDLVSCADDSRRVVIDIFHAYASADWQLVINLLNSPSVNHKSDEAISGKWLLLLAHAYRESGEPALAHKCLVKYESAVSNDPECRYEIARLSFERKQWEKVIVQLNAACSAVHELPSEFVYYYLFSLYSLGKYQMMDNLYREVNIESSDYDIHGILRVKLYMALGQWDKALEILKVLNRENEEVIYSYALVLKKLGEYKSAYLSLLNSKVIDSSLGWALRAELASLNDDWEETYKCSLRLQWMKEGSVSLSSAEIDNLVNLHHLQSRLKTH